MSTTTVHGKPAAPVIGALLLATIAFALAQTLVAPAIPALAEAYDTTPGAAAWVLTGFLLSASVCTPLAGKLGDLYGKGRVLAAVMLVFSLGSIVCALAGSIEVLIAGRVIQGVAGGVFPLSFGIVNDELTPEKRSVAIGLTSAMVGIGGALGLPLSGVIVDNVDLSWLFWVGLLALPAGAVVWRLVPPSPAPGRMGVDWAGAAVLSVGLVALLAGITRSNAWGWGSPRVLALLIGGVVILAGFVALERRVRAPLVDIRVLASRSVMATNVAAFLMGVAMFGSFLLVPQFAQAPEATGYGFGLTVTQAGLVMLPSALVMLVAGPTAGVLGTRIGFRAVLGLGAAMAGASFTLLVLAHGSVWDFVASGVLMGAGIAFALGAMANLIVDAVDRREVGVATGINTIMRTVGGAFGAALVTALLSGDVIPGTQGLPTEHAFTEAFLLAGIGSFVCLGAALAVPRVRGGRSQPAPSAA